MKNFTSDEVKICTKQKKKQNKKQIFFFINFVSSSLLYEKIKMYIGSAVKIETRGYGRDPFILDSICRKRNV